ncbi:MAG: 3' terminal RNA ribose 2'-O-methyltransferase Hen1 [Planctomycetota bacterium]
MLLTISTTHQPASDLGYLLVKHPDRCQTFDLAFGKAHVFYPECSEQRCTAALLLDLDPVGLVRGRKAPGAATLGQYVNDRPYVASSFLGVAIAQVLGSAMGGRCKGRPELADQAIALEVVVEPLPARGGEALVRRLFEPLGYEVHVTRHPLDEAFPAWGESPYYRVELRGTQRLRDLLTHLYVLVPVLDHDKHYWVDEAELAKLLEKGEGWLQGHPERELIARRYLYRQPRLARQAMAQLVEEDGVDPDVRTEAGARSEDVLEERIRLDDLRRGAVLAVLKEVGARRVLDLGCGEGKLLRTLMDDKQFEQVVGMDVSPRSLELAEKRLRVDQMPPRKRERLQLLHGSLTYRDARLAGFDAACLVEVIEHLDLPRLQALERVVFEFARPAAVIVTTPNSEYNALFETLPTGSFRHADHRFEWSRAELEAWASRVAVQHGYAARFLPVGPSHPELGTPTQMAVFVR